jgi:hypothetical protein
MILHVSPYIITRIDCQSSVPKRPSQVDILFKLSRVVAVLLQSRKLLNFHTRGWISVRTMSGGGGVPDVWTGLKLTAARLNRDPYVQLDLRQ